MTRYISNLIHINRISTASQVSEHRDGCSDAEAAGRQRPSPGSVGLSLCEPHTQKLGELIFFTRWNHSNREKIISSRLSGWLCKIWHDTIQHIHRDLAPPCQGWAQRQRRRKPCPSHYTLVARKQNQTKKTICRQLSSPNKARSLLTEGLWMLAKCPSPG